MYTAYSNNNNRDSSNLLWSKHTALSNGKGKLKKILISLLEFYNVMDIMIDNFKVKFIEEPNGLNLPVKEPEPVIEFRND